MLSHLIALVHSGHFLSAFAERDRLNTVILALIMDFTGVHAIRCIIREQRHALRGLPIVALSAEARLVDNLHAVAGLVFFVWAPIGVLSGALRLPPMLASCLHL